MLKHLHGHDLARVVHVNGDLHRLEACHIVHRGGSLLSSFLSRSSLRSRSSGGGSLQRVVDRAGGERHAGLHVDLRRRDVLANQRVKARADQVSAEARRLVVLKHVDRHDLARVVHVDRNLHRLEARHLVHIASRFGRNRLSRFGLSYGFLRLNRNAIGRSRLPERIVDGLRGQRHARLHVDLRRRQILANQRSKRFLGQDVGAQTRGLIVSRNGDGSNLTIGDSDLHGKLVKALDGIRVGRNLRAGSLQRAVDGFAGQGHTRLHVDGGTGDILAHQRIEHRGIRDQVSAEARRLVVLEHLDRHDLARVVNGNLDLHRGKAGDVVGVGGHNRLRIARSRGSSGKDRVLVTRVRGDTEGILGIGKDFGNSIHKSAGGNGRAADGVNIIPQRIRIRSDCDKLAFELILAHSGAQTGGLLKRTDIGLRDVAFGADAHGDRNRSAVALRRSGQRVADGRTGSILALEDLVKDAALGQTFVFNLRILAAREHGVERVHLGSKLLGLDRALGHFVGQRQRHGSHERENEETKRELNNITHYFLTSPKLLEPVTRSISGDTTFISRMAKEHHSAGVFLPKRNQNSSRPQPRPKMILPLLVAGEDE